VQQTSSGLFFMIVVATILVVFIVFLLVIRFTLSNRKKKAEWIRLLTELGFSPVEIPEPALVESLSRLFPCQARCESRLENVYFKPVRQGIMYVFDVIQSGGEGTSRLVGNVGFTSPDLGLPSLALIPLPGSSAGIGGVARETAVRLVEWVLLRAGLTRVHFPDQPDFENRYLVLGQDEAHIHSFLTRDRIARLVSLGCPYQVLGWGNALIVQIEVNNPGKQEPDDLRHRTETVQLIADALS
jgi:hypothetical protein